MAWDDSAPLSGLQHLVFCERQAALIHVEGAWSENRHTAQGRIEHLAVHAESSRTKLRLPIHNLEGIVALGRIGASPDLMELCGERGVGLSFMTETGRFAQVLSAWNSSLLPES